MAPTDTVDLLVIALFLVAATFLGFLYALRRLRSRKSTLAKELSDSPDLLPDRAFNAIAMARAEAGVLGRDGFDVRRQLERLDEAHGLSERRDFVGATALARSVHDTLVQIRRTGAASGPSTRLAPTTVRPVVGARPPPPGAGGSSPNYRGELLPTEPGAELADDATEPDMPATARLPKNQVESKFQLELLTEELTTAPEAEAPTREAAAFRLQAVAAFGQKEFTESLRLALRGRRRLGAKVESLASPPVALRTASASGGSGAPSSRCSNCGRDLAPEDAFCRGCGQPRPGGTCARCGGALTAADQFCGRCGAPRS
ncbi:MAG: zinc ribbon domain-containing protein [Thermoplasmata archaeon]|nr:zinc ribbon domain-containing protein [Thermoplasmata archaeon]